MKIEKATIDELTWASLTTLINEIKSPNQFLTRLLFSRRRTHSTEALELGILNKAREIAPFVEPDAEAISVQGHSQTFQTVTPPNIRIKIPFTPSPLLFGRRANTPIFISGGEQASAVRQHIATDMQVLADLITNSTEYLASQALQGVILYQVASGANFQISFPKPAGHNITLSTFWDDLDPSKPTPWADFHTAKRLISDAVGGGATHVLLGSEASDAFQALVASKGQPVLDKLFVRAGQVTLENQFTADGAIFLGTFCGVQVWEYSRSVSVGGVATPMIRPKYAEFVWAAPGAQNVLKFGAIPDWDAFDSGRIQSERFSKSWKKQDPSQMIALAASRPLPHPQRPGSMVSMKVVSG